MDEQIDIIGNLLQKKNLKTPQQIKRITTDVVDPQTISATGANGQRIASRVRFNIRREGVLEPSSTLCIPIKMQNANGRLGAAQGIYGMINRAVLKDSKGKVIAEQNDSGYLMSILNYWREDAVVERRLVIEKGVYNTLAYGSDGKLGLKLNNGNDDIVAHYRPTDAHFVEYQVSLKDLFPSLWPWSVPVSILKNYLVLEVDFNTDGHLTSVGKNGVASALVPYMDTDGVKLLTDHIVYADPVMNMLEKMGSTSKGLTMVYGNYNVVNNLLSAPGAEQETTYRRNIGYAGLRLSHILLHHQEQSADQTTQQKLLGKIGASSASVVADSSNTSLNMRINNKNYYSEDVPSKRQYKEVSDCFGKAMNVNASQYNHFSADLLSGDNMYGASQTGALRGACNVLGVNFSFNHQNGSAGNTITIGQTPIDLLYKRKFSAGADNAVDINQRVFANIERVLQIKQGEIYNTF